MTWKGGVSTKGKKGCQERRCSPPGSVIHVVMQCIVHGIETKRKGSTCSALHLYGRMCRRFLLPTVYCLFHCQLSLPIPLVLPLHICTTFMYICVVATSGLNGQWASWSSQRLFCRRKKLINVSFRVVQRLFDLTPVFGEMFRDDQ